MHGLRRWYILGGRWLKCVCNMSRQFNFASFQLGANRLHLQRRLHRTEWGLMHAVCGWKIQEYTWRRDMHRLRRWYVLGGRWLQCVCNVSHKFKFGTFQLGAYRLHLQRRLHRTQRGYVQCMCFWEIHRYVWNDGMRRLCRW